MRFDAFQAIGPVFRRLPVWAIAAIVVFAIGASARAEKTERPSAMKLFPEETVVFEYGALKIGYKPQNKDGTLGKLVERSWNKVTNSANFDS